MNTNNLIERRPYLIAIAVALILFVWIFSGVLSHAPAQQSAVIDESKREIELPRVRAVTSYAEQVTEELILYGRTAPNRTTEVKAETSGQIVSVGNPRGAYLAEGEVIVTIALKDRAQQLLHAKALLKQREIEFQGSQSLQTKGFRAETDLAKAAANLQSAKANIEKLEQDIHQTIVITPISGILNERWVEVGDFVSIGDPIAQVVDINPMVVFADVSESNISKLNYGQEASATLLNGAEVQGRIRYISSLANEITHTFRVEIEVENPDRWATTGISAEVTIPVETMMAQRVSPALLSLDKRGSIGIKTLDSNQTVEFHPIHVIRTDVNGIWISGLDEQVDIITVGQGYVSVGERVEVTYEDSNLSNSRQSTVLAKSRSMDEGS